jgi:hypothetical protein
MKQTFSISMITALLYDCNSCNQTQEVKEIQDIIKAGGPYTIPLCPG